MDNQYNQPGAGYPPVTPGGQPQSGYPQQTSSLRPPVGYIPGVTMPQQSYVDPSMGMPQQGGVDPATGMPVQGYANPMGMTGQAFPVGNGTGQVPPVQPLQQTQQMGAVPPQMGPGGYAYYNQQPYAAEGYEYHFDHQGNPVQETPAGFPPQQVNPPKKRFRIHPAVIAAVVLVVLGVGGIFLYSSLAPETATRGQIRSGSLSASHTGDCLIVRNEVPYDAEGVTSISYDAEEGSAVVRKDPICKVYSSGYSTREVRTLQEYRGEIRDYQKNLIETETTYDAKMTRYNQEVITRVREVRDMIGGARGSLGNQEKLLAEAVKNRQEHLKTKYTADQRYSRLYDDEMSQSQRIDSWTKQHSATGDGLVSFYSDGFEYNLTGNTYMNFEPRDVRNMINGQRPELTTAQKGKTTIYRMVKDGEWYVLFLSDNKDWNPVNGQIYELQLERFESTKVRAEVVNFTRSGGELLVRLKVTGPVEPVLYMRTCEAVLGESMSTLMVSERAIYVQDGMTGVVVVEGQTESFIPVNVIRYQDGNAYFQAIQQGLLFENMTVRLF